MGSPSATANDRTSPLSGRAATLHSSKPLLLVVGVALVGQATAAAVALLGLAALAYVASLVLTTKLYRRRPASARAVAAAPEEGT